MYSRAHDLTVVPKVCRMPNPTPPNPPGSSQSETSHARANSLGLTQAQLDAILDHLDGASSPTHHKRQCSRRSFRRMSVVVVVDQPGGRSAITVACRNISRGGMSFLHSSYLHIGAPCIAILKHHQKGDTQVPGVIARCRHIDRTIHEMGVRFNKPINLPDYVDVDRLDEQFSFENVDPKSLSGKLLVVADYSIDRSLIRHQLEGTQIDASYANTLDEGVRLAEIGRYDLLLFDFDLGVRTGIELLSAVRERGIIAPAILMSADTSFAARRFLREAHTDAFLSKPTTRSRLLQALAEFLYKDHPDAASPKTEIEANPDLAEEFINDLSRLASELEGLVKADDSASFLRRCTRIVATATGLGLAPVAHAAELANREVSSSMSLKESRDSVSALIALCRSGFTSNHTPAPPRADQEHAAPHAPGHD